MYRIELTSCGNPDHGQYAPVSPSDTFEAFTLEGIVRAAWKYVEVWELGAGNWTNPCILKDGEPFAYLSYNGRLWDRPPMRPGAVAVPMSR